jgi:hypothetical protein
MAGESYDGRTSRAETWGVLAGGVVGLPTFAFLLTIDALGDCAPGTACRKGFLLMVLAPTVLVASAVGLLVWFFVSQLTRER